ncbi:hypothetical protein CAP50_06460 [Psychrobacter sp. L7]|nr:hypothetical protein CAP50_06460 [Psychrobacter sp. L7]
MYDSLIDNQLTSVICHLSYLTGSLSEVVSAAALSQSYHDAKNILLPQKIVIKTRAALFFGEKKPARCRLFSTA